MSQIQQRTTWISLLFDTLIVGVLGWFLLFILSGFFNFPDERLHSKSAYNLTEETLPVGELLSREPSGGKNGN